MIRRFNGRLALLAAAGLILVACGGGGTSAPTFILEATVGVSQDNGAGTIDTAIATRLRRSDGSDASAQNVTITVRGPSGWGADQNSTLSFSRSFPVVSYLDPVAVAGTYTITASIPNASGCDCTRTVNLTDITTVLPQPVVTVQSAVTSQVILTWRASAGAASYFVGVYNRGTDGYLQSDVLNGTNTILNGLNLDPATLYRGYVAAFNFDLNSLTAPLPQRLTVARAPGIPIIIAPPGSSYQVSLAMGTSVDGNAPGQIGIVRTVRLTNTDGSTPASGLAVGLGFFTPDPNVNPIADNSTYNQSPLIFSNNIPPAAGTYRMRILASGASYEATASIPNPTQTLSPATINLGSPITASSIPITWTAPAGAQSYIVRLDDVAGGTIQSARVTATNFTFTPSTPLNPSRSYRVVVIAYSANLSINDPLPAQVNRSISRVNIPSIQ